MDVTEAAQFTEWRSLISVKILQINEVLSRSASQVYEAYGLGESERRILLLLGGGERVSVNEISRQARIDKAGVSRTIGDMMRAGLVTRVAHPSDSRKSLAFLTDKGEQDLRIIMPIALMRDRYLLAGLNKSEVHAVLDELLERALRLLMPELDQRRAPARKTSKSRKRPAPAENKRRGA